MSEIATIPASAADAEAPRRSLLRWPLYIAAFVAFIWLAGTLITFLIHHTRLHEKLTRRLESVFGRHVEVGNYQFSLWTGPTLVAESVTFNDDPRFGNEYFLHAEAVEVRLHWQSLFRGHMDLGTVTLQRPSLNLVRDAAGDWNVAEWLPRITNESSFAKTAAAPAASATPASPQPYVRFDRVLFNDGRINFKRVEEKIAFALTDVTGSVEPDSPGRWRIDLEAIPTRAAVPLQQAGTIHVAAQVGGTSSRFRPATLALTWQQGSVSDLLRLARGYDFGVRGDFALAANAHAESDDWHVETTTRFRSIHRWDLSLRPDNPDFNVVAKFSVHPQASGFDVEHATIEAPHSRAEAAAHISWDLAPFASRAIELATGGPNADSAPTRVEITQSQIDFRDVLGWIRAFHPEVPADTLLTGSATATATISAAPARLVSADIHTDGAELSNSALRGPTQISPVEFHFDRGSVSLAPVTATFGDPANSLRIEASSKPTARDGTGYHVTGSVEQVRDLVAAASSLGWHISRGWDVTGPARIDLHWAAEGWPWKSQPSGTIDFGGDFGGESPAASSNVDADRDATLLAPFINEPVRAIKAHVDVRPDYRRITLASADAFGARWTGTLERHEAVPGWEFALSADHLATADVDRWLNPRWRQSLLVRVLPFLGGSAPSASPEALHAQGRISIDQLTVAPLVAHHVQGELKLNGREVDFTNATAQIASGNLSGTLNASLAAVPRYQVKINVANVDLGDLSAFAPSLANQFDGAATGEITLASRGASRADLAAALSCDGTLRAAPLQLKNLNLDQTLRQAELRVTPESFHEAIAAFTCSDSSIDINRLTLTNPNERIDATGTVDFSRQLDLALKTNAVPGAAFQLTGPLASPSVKKIATPKP